MIIKLDQPFLQGELSLGQIWCMPNIMQIYSYLKLSEIWGNMYIIFSRIISEKFIYLGVKNSPQIYFFAKILIFIVASYSAYSLTKLYTRS